VPRKVEIDDQVWIPLSDGTRLSARIWFPAVAQPHPAILEYHPYPKDYATARRDEIAHGYFASRGYVSIRVDMRGSGDSEGLVSDEYTAQERSDALEVIAWIAKQTWCSGAVGMYGLSWGGFNSLQIAARAPGPLKAVAVAGATDDRYRDDCHFVGGVMTSEHIGWAATLLSFLTRPPDPATVGRRWRKLWKQRLEALEWVLPTWLAHPARDSFWTDGFPCAHPQGLQVPALVAGGTADVFATSVLRMVARQPDLVKGVVGPWTHKFPHMGIPGPAIDWMATCTRWFDRWLKGERNGAENDPALRLFMTHSYAPSEHSASERSGRWLAVPTYPRKAPKPLKLRLGADGRLGDTSSRRKIPIATPEDLGVAGGEIMPMGWGADLPGDQREDDARSVCFETLPLTSALDVLGQPSLTLHLECDRADAFCVARLCDVAPDGRSTRIAFGARNLSLADDLTPAADIKAGRPFKLRLDLGAVAHRFAKGHRVRIALSNSYWPMLWPSARAGALTLSTGGSALALPKPPPGTKIWKGFNDADGVPPLPRRKLKPASFERTILRDVARGETTVMITDTADVERSHANGLETWGRTLRRYEIADGGPADASIEIERTLGVERGDWRVSTEVNVLFKGNERRFSWDVSLEAHVGDKRLVRRSFKGSADRSPKRVSGRSNRRP